MHEEEFWYDRRMDGSLNRWFTSYEEAKSSQREFGGYLLPFRTQFVVCETAAIRALGLDPNDSDWNLIGHDVVRPGNSAACSRLEAKREAYRKQSRG